MAHTEKNMKQPERKPYHAPRLVQYGSLRKLTRDTACNENKDGGSHASCRRT
jgi:hypothetical protein